MGHTKIRSELRALAPLPRAKHTAIEICAGLGGIGIGLRELGFHVARAYDSWQGAVDVYNYNFPGEVAVSCNILSEHGRQVIAADRRRIGDIDLLAAGPPCKGFSQIRNGHHDGRNGQNRVLASIPDYVELLRPRMFLIENVPELARHRGGKTLAAVLKRLERPARRLKYRVECKIYDAAEFGTPQARRRILILGVLEGSGKETLPEPGPDLSQLFAAIRHSGKIPSNLEGYLDALKNPNDGTLTTTRQALSDLPALGPGAPEIERDYACRAQSKFQRWVRTGAPKMLSNTRTPSIKVDTERRLRHISPGRYLYDIPERYLDGLSRRHGSAYRRLHPDAPSTALSTKYDCVYHYNKQRSLSVREYARLQGIPDRIAFPANLVCRRSAYEMIGNSVPPLLIERVLGRALET